MLSDSDSEAGENPLTQIVRNIQSSSAIENGEDSEKKRLRKRKKRKKSKSNRKGGQEKNDP